METRLPPRWKHQDQAIEKARDLPGFALFNDPGTGKSRTVIDILCDRFAREQRLMRTLIFAPPIVLDNWKTEWRKYTNLPPSNVTVLSGAGKRRLEEFERLANYAGRQDKRDHIFVTNYESLIMEDLFEAFLSWKPEAVIFDECHRLANYKAKRAKRADSVANPRAGARPLVYMLSGTPVMNSMLDIFQQYKILDGGKTFGTNFFVFRGKYFRDKNAHMNKQNYFPAWAPIPGAQDEISRLMTGSSMRVKKEDCLDLPPLVDQIIEVEMTAKQSLAYKQMAQDYVAYFEKNGQLNAAVATMAMTKGMRLMQIASGFVKTDEGKDLTFDEGWTPKQTALCELLEELTPGHKVIIWANWRHNYAQIREVCEHLKIPFLEMNGDMGPAKNRENAALFEKDEKYRVIVGHAESGGEGINLVSASYSIDYSRDYSYRRFVQKSARNYRGGSERHEKITRIILVTKGTIEGEIARKLAGKEELSEQVLLQITYRLAKGGSE